MLQSVFLRLGPGVCNWIEEGKGLRKSGESEGNAPQRLAPHMPYEVLHKTAVVSCGNHMLIVLLVLTGVSKM